MLKRDEATREFYYVPFSLGTVQHDVTFFASFTIDFFLHFEYLNENYDRINVKHILRSFNISMFSLSFAFLNVYGMLVR